MVTLSSTIYLLDSRQRAAGSSIESATFNLAALGSAVEAGTYSMLSFNSRNNVYNVDSTNDEIYFDEISGGELGPATLTHGYYASPADLGAEIKVAMELAGAGTYTVTFDTTTNLFNIAVAVVADFIFTWGTNSTQPLANNLLGFRAVNSAVSAASQTSDKGVNLDPHTNLLLSISEDALKNITLVNGTEFSLMVPLTAPYGSEINALKSQTFSQTIAFNNSMNQLNVSLFTEDGVALSSINASDYVLTISRIF